MKTYVKLKLNLIEKHAKIGTDAWGSGSGPVWQSSTTTNTTPNLWTSIDTTTEQGGTPSNLKPYLPENLLDLN